MRQNAYLTK